MKVARDKALAEEEDRVAKKLRGEEDDEDKKEDVTMGEDEEAAALQAALAMSIQEEQSPVGPGLPHDFQGLYELFAVVTHKGRDADGGHYMGWVKADNTDRNGLEKKREKIADRKSTRLNCSHRT